MTRRRPRFRKRESGIFFPRNLDDPNNVDIARESSLCEQRVFRVFPAVLIQVTYTSISEAKCSIADPICLVHCSFNCLSTLKSSLNSECLETLSKLPLISLQRPFR